MDAHHLVATELNPKIQDFRPGDTVRVSTTVREGDRQRTQVLLPRIGLTGYLVLHQIGHRTQLAHSTHQQHPPSAR